MAMQQSLIFRSRLAAIWQSINALTVALLVPGVLSEDSFAGDVSTSSPARCESSDVSICSAASGSSLLQSQYRRQAQPSFTAVQQSEERSTLRGGGRSQLHNPSGCFEDTRLEQSKWGDAVTPADAQLYLKERKARQWGTGLGFTKFTDISYCPSTESAATHFREQRQNTHWPEERLNHILDEALAAIENNGRPLVWTTDVTSYGLLHADQVTMMTANFLCNMRQAGLSNRTLLLVENVTTASSFRAAFPEVAILQNDVLLQALRDVVQGGGFEVTGYRLPMHHLLLQRGYPVLHMDMDQHVASGPALEQELLASGDEFDILGMWDCCPHMELNGGFQYYKPNKRTLAALEVAAGMLKPFHEGDMLATANDQWALNCGVFHGVAHMGLRVKMLSRDRFRFRDLENVSVGAGPNQALVVHTSRVLEENVVQLYKNLSIWLLASDEPSEENMACSRASP
eukprot:TRINITY_DN11502_c0_g1_i1.p1 TRINITY_DN11502_c0_g1~~TRINITY_DN11502_c0_g1_i1.p1  ORF type:complete len:457 (+),score=48.26 TRINITY_DN11502_c0_g1_i1:468-1838(+)